MAIATSALLRAGRVFDPEKITSSIDAARMDLCDDSPMTQRSASTRFDLPHPFGPTTPVSPGSITKSVGSTNDLKPSRRSLVSFIALRPHCTFLLAHTLRPSCTAKSELRERRLVGSLREAGRERPPVHQVLHSLIQQAFPGLGRVWLPICRVGRRMNRRARKGNCRADGGHGFPDLSGGGRKAARKTEPYRRPARPKNPYQPLR